MPPRRARRGATARARASHPYRRGRGRAPPPPTPRSSSDEGPSVTRPSIVPPTVSSVADLSIEELVSLVGRVVSAQRDTPSVSSAVSSSTVPLSSPVISEAHGFTSTVSASGAPLSSVLPIVSRNGKSVSQWWVRCGPVLACPVKKWRGGAGLDSSCVVCCLFLLHGEIWFHTHAALVIVAAM